MQLAFGLVKSFHNIPWMHTVESAYLTFLLLICQWIPAAAVSYSVPYCADAGCNVNDPLVGFPIETIPIQRWNISSFGCLGTSIYIFPLVVMLSWAHPQLGRNRTYRMGMTFLLPGSCCITSWNIPFLCVIVNPRIGMSIASLQVIRSIFSGDSAAIFHWLQKYIYGSLYASTPRFVLQLIRYAVIYGSFISSSNNGTETIDHT